MTQHALAAATSPCTGICRLDAATGWCLGCARTGEEIGSWRSQSPLWRDGVWSELPDRLAKLGVTCRRLAWDASQIRAFVLRSLEQGTGAWQMGVEGAVAVFTEAAGHATAVSQGQDVVTARTKGGAIRLSIDDDVRALTFDPPATPASHQRIVLAVKRERCRMPIAHTVKLLDDDDTDRLSDDPGRLYDLGLGRRETRFCLRTEASEVKAVLDVASGSPLQSVLPKIGSLLLDATPTRVVETPLGRVEVTSPIPKWGGRSLDGPRTHLLLDRLARGRDLTLGMSLPPAYVVAAVFSPRVAAAFDEESA